jgi:hypothetical protein
MNNIQNHWNGFLNALGKAYAPASSNTTIPFETPESKIGVSGFLDVKSANPTFQTRYNSMSGPWEGIAQSETSMPFK